MVRPRRGIAMRYLLDVERALRGARPPTGRIADAVYVTLEVAVRVRCVRWRTRQPEQRFRCDRPFGNPGDAGKLDWVIPVRSTIQGR
jgi:hypothetical protein